MGEMTLKFALDILLNRLKMHAGFGKYTKTAPPKAVNSHRLGVLLVGCRSLRAKVFMGTSVPSISAGL